MITMHVNTVYRDRMGYIHVDCELLSTQLLEEQIVMHHIVTISRSSGLVSKAYTNL